MSKTAKKFDSVAMMRSSRDRLSAQIEGMALEEELAWLASQEIRDPLLCRLRDTAMRRARGAEGSSPLLAVAHMS